MLLESWIKTKDSSKNTLLAVLIIIEVIAIFNWMIRPHTGYLKASMQYSSLREDLVRKGKVLTVDIRNKNHQIEQLTGTVEAARAKFFSAPEADMFLNGIQGTAEKSNCLVSSIRFSTPRILEGVTELGKNCAIASNQATVKVKGSYKAITSFIYRLQKRSQQVTVDSVDIKLLTEQYGRLTCDITVTIYIMDDKGKFIDE